MDKRRNSSSFCDSDYLTKTFGENIHVEKHILTSAKYGKGVRDAFELGLDYVVTKIQTLSMTAQTAYQTSVPLWRKILCCLC